MRGESECGEVEARWRRGGPYTWKPRPVATYAARPKVIAREKHAPFVCIAKSEKSHEPSITVESTSITAYQRLRSTTSSMP